MMERRAQEAEIIAARVVENCEKRYQNAFTCTVPRSTNVKL